MKKYIYVAVFTASGLIMVSCDADSVESGIGELKKQQVHHQVAGMAMRETDTISLNDTLVTNLVEDPGPGDDPMPVTPPPPPKP